MPRADVVLVFPHKTDPLVFWGDDGRADAHELRPPTNAEKHQMEMWQLRRGAVVSALRAAGLTATPVFSRDRENIFVSVRGDKRHLPEPEAGARPGGGQPEPQQQDRPVSADCASDRADSSAADRIRVIDHVVRSQDHGCAGVDISHLTHNGDILRYFPLHEPGALARLDEDWLGAVALGSHRDQVRDYFGERVAMYFLFLAHWHAWLAPLAAAGLVLWWAELLCGGPSSSALVLRCGVVGLWAAMFPHFWRRKCAVQALHWGTLHARPSEDSARAEFVGVERLNPVTRCVDRHYPWEQRLQRQIFSAGVVAVALCVLGLLVALLLALRHGLIECGGRRTAQVASALVVEVLCGAVAGLARGLTDRENHRTQAEHVTHLLAKTLVLKGALCYGPLFCIGVVMDRTYLFGISASCVDDNCLSDLGSQLAAFLVMRLLVQGLFEYAAPLLLSGEELPADGVSQALSTTERECSQEQLDVNEDMDDVIIVFGYTAFFGGVCPWVPLLVLFGSLLRSCLVDRAKVLFWRRRPFPMVAAHNEPWDTAFDVCGAVAVVANAALAVFSSQTFVSWHNHAQILLFLCLEHALISTRVLVGCLYPEVPWTVKRQDLMRRFRGMGSEEADREPGEAEADSHTQPLPRIFEGEDFDEDNMWT